jgi:hypothetical protein
LTNETIVSDFDIIYATQTGLQRADDIPFELDWASDWQGAFQTGRPGSLRVITAGTASPKVSDSSFQGCNEPNRNLWIAVTRTKISSPQTQEGDFLGKNSRQLQGHLFNDIEFAFTSI